MKTWDLIRPGALKIEAEELKITCTFAKQKPGVWCPLWATVPEETAFTKTGTGYKFTGSETTKDGYI